MSYYGADVRTPIFYRQSFASALEAQSSKTYARLTHTPVIARHLPCGAASGARIMQYGTTRLRSLDELEKLLLSVLEDEDARSGVNPLHFSTHEPGLEECERTVLSPSSLARVQATQPQTSKKDVHSQLHAVGSPANESLSAVNNAHTEDKNTNNFNETTACSPRRVPRSVSFPVDSCSVTPRLPEYISGNEPNPFTSRSARLWRWMRGWVWREAQPTPYSLSSAATRERDELGDGGNASARDYRPEYTNVSMTATQPLPASPSLPAPPPQAKSTLSAAVPTWVRAAFTPAAAAIAAVTVDSNNNSKNIRSTNSHGCRMLSVRETCGGTAEEEEELEEPSESLPRPESSDGGILLDGRFFSAPISGNCGCRPTNNNDNDGHWQEGAPLHASNRAGICSQSTQSPRPPCSAQEGSSLLSNAVDPTLRWRQRAVSDGAQEHSADSILRDLCRTAVPVDNSSTLPPTPSKACTHDSVSVAEGGYASAQSEYHRECSSKNELPAPVTSTVASVSTAPGGAKTQPFTESSCAKSTLTSAPSKRYDNSKYVAASRSGKTNKSSTPTTASDKHKFATASSSFTGHNKLQQGGSAGEPQCILAQHSFLSHTTAADTNELGRWDRHVYAVELVGWLHLLVWVRCQVIHFLRDLSGVQGFVAWSAWYWSWAQEHPRQASIHQALSSRRFWRGLCRQGLGAQLSQVQYETSGHMFTLKNEFRLIVSYIGAAYTSLEQLNSVILQIQHQCEMTASPMAAAAAVRSCVAGLGAGGGGVRIATIPELNSCINRAYTMGKQNLCSAQNSLLWSPAPVTVVADDFSPLAPRPREHVDGRVDTLAGPHGVHRSAFEDTCEQESVNETAVAEAAEDAEAAAALQVLDKLRAAVWSMLQDQQEMFLTNGRQLDVLETNDYFAMPGDLPHVEGQSLGNASTTHATGLPMHSESVPFNTLPVPDAFLGSLTARLPDEARSGDGDKDGAGGGSRPVTARDGAVALLQCVQHSRRLVLRLKMLVQRAHSPPASRHWQRIVVATATMLPPFIWLYRKTPAELIEIVRVRCYVAQQIAKSYLLEPMAQLKESLFYVRPGVEDRRGAFERDAVSLANIIRDFHEDMYPNMPLDRLEKMRDVTLDRLRAGVGDPEGFGLIEQQYRHSVRHPIRSIFFGDLPRILLIQMSYQALEMSRVANGVDEVLEGNDLNFKIMALLPVFAAGGLLVTWSFLRHRANYKPIRMRLKLLWRSLFRVISFAGSGQQVMPPFMWGLTQHAGSRVRTATLSFHFPRRTHASNSEGHTHTDASNTTRDIRRRSCTRPGASAAAAATPAGTRRRKAEERHVEEFRPASFTESSEDDTSSLAASVNTGGGVASARQLSNYEQGMVLLLSHVIRSLAAEYLRSYEYFHELVEDLNDLESVQSSRHQRLATLERMRATHAFLF